MFLLISELKSVFFTFYKKLNLRTFSDNFSVLIKQINWSKKSIDQKRGKKRKREDTHPRPFSLLFYSKNQNSGRPKRVPRTPIIVTGNDLSTLFAPLLRDGEYFSS